MTKSQELRQKAAQKNKALGKLLTKVSEESRSYTEEEQSQVDALKKEIEDLEARAKDLEFAEQRAADDAGTESHSLERQAGGNSADRGEAREQARIMAEYRFTRAVGAQLRKEALTGVEKEMQEEARAEAARFGQSVEGAAVPAFFLEERASTAGSTPSAGVTIDTRLTGMVEPLRPEPMVVGLGTRLVTGLTANWDILRQTGVTTATWVGETDPADETTPTFDRISLSPKRLAAYTEASRQLLIQSEVPAGFENFLRADLRIAMELALDRALIDGAGTSNIPEGILNTTGIGSVAIGANGGAPTRTHILALMAEVRNQDAQAAAMAFLTNTKVMAKLMDTKLDSGSGRFLLEQAQANLLGYRAAFSNQIPADLSKGTSTNTLSAIIFGDFRQLVVGGWGGMDLVVDPYTKARNGMVALTINSFWDAAVRQPKSFAAIKDANPSLA